MGGAVALKAHLKEPHGWDGVILVAPMCKVSPSYYTVHGQQFRKIQSVTELFWQFMSILKLYLKPYYILVYISIFCQNMQNFFTWETTLLIL